MTAHTAQSILLDMEEDILAVRRWAGVLSHLGAGANAVEPTELHVIAMAVLALGASLERNWTAAVDTQGGRP